jgi:hypothetical protein
MLNAKQQAETSSAGANANPALETIQKWLQGLPAHEVKALGEALANRDEERLARFRVRFHAWLERSG